ncbi:MAG: S49 family peptidase [Parachlamydiales bacterium]|jgi:protease-4
MHSDSLFKSALRTFLRTFFFIFGLFGAIFLITSITGPFQPDKEGCEITLLPDLEGNNLPLGASAPVVLRINIQGVIGAKDNLTTEMVRDLLLETHKGFFKKDRLKAVFLYCNTPGGTVSDSDGIYSLLKAFKEKYHLPVYAYVEGLLASGGLYIAASADKIYTSPVANIGSVGVIVGPFFNLFKLFDKIGIEGRSLSEGKNKDLFSPFRPWTENEDESLKPLIGYTYERFVNVLTSARPKLSKAKLVQEYGAKIFSAPEAEKIGFTDNSHSSYEEALLELLKAAKIDPAKPYQLVQLKPKKKWLNEFFTQSFLFKSKITHELDLGPLTTLSGNCAYLYLPQ